MASTGTGIQEKSIKLIIFLFSGQMNFRVENQGLARVPGLPRNTGDIHAHPENSSILHAKAEYMGETFLFQPVIRK